MKLPGRAFTLVEMMVVLTISLLMMSMIVPIFRVTTKTVQIVERKLAVYDAARNILDLIETEISIGVANEKGQHWSIKHTSWMDTDQPFTPPSPSPALTPGITDVNSMAFKQSRRYADALDYIRMEGGGMMGGPRTFPGGKAFPTAYVFAFWDAMQAEAWKASMRTTLLYQSVLEWNEFDSTANMSDRWNRPQQLADVSQSELSFVYYPFYDQWVPHNLGNKSYDQVNDFNGPGKEIRAPHWYQGYIGVQIQRRLGQMKIMDLSLSYWDDSPAAGGGKQFKDLPDNTIAYFWPPPKAVRVTVTVCDRDKRDILTLCRVVQIPMGTGQASINTAAMDSAYYTPNMGTFSAANPPAIYNRTKYMPNLPVALNGDSSNPYWSDQAVSSESTTILSDPPAKPYNWP